MRSLYESIIDTDSKIKNDVAVNSILIKIMSVLIRLFGEDYQKASCYQLLNDPHTSPSILFNNNDGKYKTFTGAIQALKKELYNIGDIDINIKIRRYPKVFRNYPKDSIFEAATFSIFYDDEKILEFTMSNSFVNYTTPINGLSYCFTTHNDYLKFIDLF